MFPACVVQKKSICTEMTLYFIEEEIQFAEIKRNNDPERTALQESIINSVVLVRSTSHVIDNVQKLLDGFFYFRINLSLRMNNFF